MIEIYTEELPVGWEWTPSSYVGGTQEFYVETASVLKNITNVVVYYDGKACSHNGVNYLPRKYFQGKDVVLSCNSKPPKMGRYNIAWANWAHKRQNEYQEFDERITQSPYHYELFGGNSRIVPPSVHSDKFVGGIKEPKLCLYSSSPDRGGEFLREIWNDVKKATNAVLITTYSKSISEEKMIELYKKSSFWLHPCQGIELFCISAAKAQVAGCIPVVVPSMALATTVKYGIKTTIENYKQDLINAINNPPPVEKVDFGSWESVTKDLFKAVL